MSVDFSTSAAPYNFTILSEDDPSSVPYSQLSNLSELPESLKSVTTETVKLARKVLGETFLATATHDEKLEAYTFMQQHQSDLPILIQYDKHIDECTNINQLLTFSNQTIDACNEKLQRTNLEQVRVRLAHFTPSVPPLDFAASDLNHALLDLELELLEKKISKETPFELLSVATKIANLNHLITGEWFDPDKIAKISGATLLKKINDLHRHKLNGDQQYKARIENVVKNRFPISAQLQFRSTEDDAVNGINGSYFVEDNQGAKKNGIFKPFVEQHTFGMKRSPSDFGRVARGAYLLDLNNGGLASVPMTVVGDRIFLPSLSQEERLEGHLQTFVDNLGSYAELTNDAVRSIPVSEIQRQLSFRGRIMDPDAHQYNILWTVTNKGTIKLIPIDMDYSFVAIDDPMFMETDPYSILAQAPQAKLPYLQSEIDWIQSWDADRDAQTLRDLGLSEGSAQMIRFTTWFYQKACKEFTPREVYDLIGDPNLKRAVSKAYNKAFHSSSTLSTSEKSAQFETEVKKSIDGFLREQESLSLQMVKTSH